MGSQAAKSARIRRSVRRSANHSFHRFNSGKGGGCGLQCLQDSEEFAALREQAGALIVEFLQQFGRTRWPAPGLAVGGGRIGDTLGGLFHGHGAVVVLQPHPRVSV